MTARIGGDLVVETLTQLGAADVFGLPGQHALGTFDALNRGDLRYAGFRTETAAAFAADGYARMQDRVVPLLVSTGPGALFTLPALQESLAASVPVLGISAQIPTAGLGGGRHGYLHELRDQRAVFAEVAKHTETVRTASQLPDAIAAAWQAARTPPCGPTWVEIPQDIAFAETSVPRVGGFDLERPTLPPRSDVVRTAAQWLDSADRIVILAGGGVIRSGGADALRRLADRLQAPVATTFGGKGAFPWDHDLSLQSWLEDSHLTEALASADVLLVVGSGLGELSSTYHTLKPRGRVIHVDADRGKLGVNAAALGIAADARETCRQLADTVRARPNDGIAQKWTAAVVARIRERLDTQDRSVERAVLDHVRAAIPAAVPTFWDMTILAYWAWSAWPASGPGLMHSAQGAGGLGYAYPAALGAACAVDGPVLAVSGDGGAMYGIAELATARQLGLDVIWLIVDDGGYGILREYMNDAFGSATATELERPDFVALAESFGVPGVETSVKSLRTDLAEAFELGGPRVVVLPQHLRMFAPTHT
ncbi:MAG TPA: thiamine pyrophosphate-binding protein [Nocardioidaceae bacterium]|nr:thiamine pyrophosphate-binding protein [Nocardioidaceae bacterium]